MTHQRPLQCFLLAAPFVLAVAGCGSSDDGGADATQNGGAAGHDAAAAAHTGGMSAAAPDDDSSGPGDSTANADDDDAADDGLGDDDDADPDVSGTGGAPDDGTGGTSDQGIAGTTHSAAGAGPEPTAGTGPGTGGATALGGDTGTGAELDDGYARATVSKRNLIPVPSAYTMLQAEPIRQQLELYDPGSLIRCDVHEDPAYNEVIDTLGGVSWGYNVNYLEDESQPRFLAGFPDNLWLSAGGVEETNDSGAVEIEESDILGLSDTSALFYSPEHGLLMVDLSGEVPTFDCATKLPGRVDKFFYYQGHLVAMTQQYSGGAPHSALLHFDVTDGVIRFVESVDLGAVSILDTRRFNGRLVVYTDLTLEDQGKEPGAVAPVYYESRGLHRMLRIFNFGETLTEEMTDTLLDTSPSSNQLTSGGLDPETDPGALVADSSSFGSLLWASDHYFVVTELLSKTYLTSWETRNYSVCVESHTVEVPYRDCRTIYEERPNPDYTPPDNSGGDRACNGTTLSDCLRAVSRASNPTIQVPVGTECQDRIRTNWICDARESRSYTYPNLDTTFATRLYIYEYTDDGFVRLDSQVSEITTQGLDAQNPENVVPVLSTSTDTYDLAVPGMLQTLYFQNDMLYAIADGVLQTYAMGGSSMVRTSTLDAVDGALQTSLFTDDKLYLSDFSYSSYHDQSVLRVIDLSNPAFPRQASEDRTLPGGHSVILPVERGILTIGTVADFEPGIQQIIKLGMFTDPFASELSYLILGTDLDRSYLGDTKAHTFDSAAQRLFLPYYGYLPDASRYVTRIGVSHLDGTSIVSEGAVVTPELPQRVRLRPGAVDEALSFASSSIEWLRPAGEEWGSTPVLEYFKPIALYRLNDEDDYIEVLQLGQECKLHFAAADTINVTRGESITDAFECHSSYPWAYANNIVFSATSGVEFNQDGSTRMLSEEEITALYELRPQRQYCLFSMDLVQNTAIDYENPPPIDDMVCYTPEEYQNAYDNALGQDPTG